jgi:hypothetical protein
MDIQFSDLSEVPLPPDEVRIRKFAIEPYPDSKRLRVYLELTPFQKRPSGEILVTNLLGTPVANANIIEAIDFNMTLTLHLRSPEAAGQFLASVKIFYTESLDEITEGDQILKSPDRTIVDETEVSFEI